LHAHFPKCRHRLDPAAWSGDLCEEPVTFLGGGAGVSCFRMRCRSRTSPSRPACRCACPPVKPAAGAGESQIGDIGRGSGRRSYRQQPWLSSLSAVPQARCVRNPRRCQVLLTDRPECRACVRARALLARRPLPAVARDPHAERHTRQDRAFRTCVSFFGPNRFDADDWDGPVFEICMYATTPF
jgi:hypothetical protein